MYQAQQPRIRKDGGADRRYGKREPRVTEVSERQEEAFRLICRFMAREKFAPTVRELAIMMDVSINCARGYVNALKRKGKIQIRRNISRGIVLPG
jgi:Mn-dependent DtxR family transcriptional regulator